MAGCFFKPSFCCCGCLFKDGPLALLYITMLFWGIISLFCFIQSKYINEAKYASWAVLVCFILPKIAGIYGIHRKISALLIPPMVTEWILIVIWGGLIFGFNYVREHVLSFIQKLSSLKITTPELKLPFDAKINPSGVDLTPTILKEGVSKAEVLTNSVFIIAVALVLLCIGFQFYLFTIVLGRFLKMNKEKKVEDEQVQMTIVDNFNHPQSEPKK